MSEWGEPDADGVFLPLTDPFSGEFRAPLPVLLGDGLTLSAGDFDFFSLTIISLLL